ncbi:MAG: phytoene desaturase [Chloroflexota bacterium]|nr:phytoene desaturase [Chloroflexota bacterium]
MQKDIIVIGSGFGGLAAAIRLAAKGHKVNLFEKRDKPGGRAYVFEQDGFKFDAGPTVITAPFMFDDLWKAAGKRREDYFELVKCNPYYRIFDHKGRYFDYNSDEASILRQMAERNPADAANYTRFMKTSKFIFEKGFALIDYPFLSLIDMFKVAPDLIMAKSYLSVYQYVAQFFKDEFLRRCFSFHPLLIGGNPFTAPSIYALVDYLEQEWGILYAMGGTGAIIAAMVKLLEELGGKIHLNSEVQEILVQDRCVMGVRLADGTVHRSDIIVSNGDVANTYRKLIPERYRRKNSNRRIEGIKYSMSLVVIYFGTKRRYDESNLAHHSIILGERYKDLLKEIFGNKALPKDFSLYLHRPSKTDPTVAPDGCESFYVLSPVPNMGSEIDWAKAAKPYRDTIMKFLEENYLPDLQQNIVVEHMVDPRYFQHELNSYLGASFAVQPLLLQSAWFRPHNRSEDFDNLYIVGAGTHPGAGLPGVLASAIIAERLISQSI